MLENGKTINLIYAFSFLGRVANAVWNQLPLTLLVHMETKSDLRVGIVAGIAGISQLLGAPLAAYVADTKSRSIVFLSAGYIFLFAIVLTVIAIYIRSYNLLLVTMVLWGFGNALSYPTCDAVIADTVATGERSGIYTTRSSLQALGSGTGPMVSLVMFAVLGDTWKIGELQTVIYAGLVVQLLPAAIMFMFPYLPSPGAISSTGQVELKSLTNSVYSVVHTEDPDENPENNDTKNRTQNQSNNSSNLDEDISSKEFLWWVPSVIVITDINSMLASGMSVKFFAVFFKENMNMNPTLVTVIYMV